MHTQRHRYICTYIYEYRHLYLYLYPYTYTCTYSSTYTYYTHIHTYPAYTHTHTCTYINMVTPPVRGRAFGDMFLLVQHGGVAKTRAKYTFCMGEKLSQVPKTLQAHANIPCKCILLGACSNILFFFSAGLEPKPITHSAQAQPPAELEAALP